MGRIICHYKGYYNIYTTISDGFIFDSPFTLYQLEQYIKDECGNQGIHDLSGRLERAHCKGCSSLFKEEDLKSLLICNRAGKAEKHLSFKECIKQFLTP